MMVFPEDVFEKLFQNISSDDKIISLCKELMFVLIYSIVLVGGDGSYHQAVNGLMRRLLKEAGLDENDSTTDLPCFPIPIGMIPAGLILASGL